MKIETKYDVGQKVYFFAKGKIQCEKIYSVDIKQTYFEGILFLGFKRKSEIRMEVSYYIHNFGFFSENDLFTTKEDLINFIK